MNIQFTSSLTPDDENAMAPALLNACCRILDLLPIAYMIRIETSDARIYEHIGSSEQPGLDLHPSRVTVRRFYPASESTSHVI